MGGENERWGKEELKEEEEEVMVAVVVAVVMVVVCVCVGGGVERGILTARK